MTGRTDELTQQTGGSTAKIVVAVTWTNQVMTRGIIRLGKKNATWPAYRVPRGTVGLVVLVERF
jgi:hypothetical protein